MPAQLLNRSVLGHSTGRLEPEVLLKVPSYALYRPVSSRLVKNWNILTSPSGVGLRPFARWDADVNPAKRHVCLSLVSVVYSNHCAFKTQAGFRSIDRIGARSRLAKMFYVSI